MTCPACGKIHQDLLDLDGRQVPWCPETQTLLAAGGGSGPPAADHGGRWRAPGSPAFGVSEPSTSARQPAAEHPTPWRWDDASGGWLVDAADAPVVSVAFVRSDPPRSVISTSPAVRELIRLAPEFEWALRYFVEMTEGISPIHPEHAKARQLLTSLDAARKGTI